MHAAVVTSHSSVLRGAADMIAMCEIRSQTVHRVGAAHGAVPPRAHLPQQQTVHIVVIARCALHTYSPLPQDNAVDPLALRHPNLGRCSKVAKAQ